MNRPIQQVVIPKESSRRLISAFKDLYNKTSEEEFFLEKKEHQSIIESTLHSETLNNIRSFHSDNCCNILLLRSLAPNLTIPPTPKNMNDNRGIIKVCSAVIISVLNYGRVSEITYQKKYIEDGSNIDPIVHQVFAWEKTQNDSIFSSRGCSSLDFHSDRWFADNHPSTPTPDVLAFFGLRCDKNVPTRIIFNNDIIKKMDQYSFNYLRDNKICISSKKSSNSNQSQDRYVKNFKRISIISIDDYNSTVLRWGGQSSVSPYNSEECKTAIMNLMRAIEQCDQYHIVLESGDLMMLKNKRVLHAREAYTPKFDGSDRWLLRVYGRFTERNSNWISGK